MRFSYVSVSKNVAFSGAYEETNLIKDKLAELISSKVLDYISGHVDISSKSTRILETSSRFNILNLDDENLTNIVDIKKINDIRYLNKFFEAVNEKLPYNGLFIGNVETIDERRQRILGDKPTLFKRFHYSMDFLVKRVFPKTKLTRKIYFILTRGENRSLSLPETLGRLISCGFKIMHYQEIDNRLYFVAKKISPPAFDLNPSYGPLFKMRRIGQHGKVIQVYKLRTMHPYAEYLQQYVYEMNSLETGGKFKDDFRITSWGRLFRKLWLDELPMIINLLKGDLKLVGVRPLSSHYMSLYTEELKQRRIKYKPGLVPPYYVDLPKTLEEIMDSEIRYLDAYEKSPMRTDLTYFFKAFYNIIFKRARSS
ncbi:MAG: sugar transferase [Ignavibacteriaceae bacterium]|nr:sugar transferase [Ignavibacteriaceae bacterium]